ncbi:MAG: hypothetical protein ACRCZO_02200, partial [Cetobacterium sp.]
DVHVFLSSVEKKFLRFLMKTFQDYSPEILSHAGMFTVEGQNYSSKSLRCMSYTFPILLKEKKRNWRRVSSVS